MKKIQRKRTGLYMFDRMIGGGFPVGRIIEIFGYPHSGKTTLALELCKAFEKVYYIDFEHEQDEEYHAGIGVNNIDIVQPMTFEEGVDGFFHEIWDKGKTKNTEYDLVVIDSIGSAVTKSQMENDIEDNDMGTLAKKVSEWARKAEKIYKAMDISCITINHRKPSLKQFGPPEYSPGGLQKEHSFAVRLALSSGKNRIHKDGIKCFIKQRKNKISNDIPYNECEYLIERGTGISRGAEALDLGIELGIIKRRGVWYDMAGERKFQGKESVIKFLDKYDKVRDSIYGKYDKEN